MSLGALELTWTSVTYRGLVCHTDKEDWLGRESTNNKLPERGSQVGEHLHKRSIRSVWVRAVCGGIRVSRDTSTPAWRQSHCRTRACLNHAAAIGSEREGRFRGSS